MTINIALQLEQQQRVENDLIALENQRQEEASLNTDKHSKGYFEGFLGMKPAHPEDYIYWSGYEVGIREYWANKLKVEIPTKF